MLAKILLCLSFCLIVFMPITAAEPSQSEQTASISFTPPKGWRFADQQALLPNVHIMVVGKGKGTYPPSMNLASEPFTGTLKDYLVIVKNLNSAQGFEWKDLGSLQTEAGPASLSQVDIKSKWGQERLMHVILKKDERIYILTAAALKDDFSTYYQQFFQSMRSLQIKADPSN